MIAFSLAKKIIFPRYGLLIALKIQKFPEVIYYDVSTKDQCGVKYKNFVKFKPVTLPNVSSDLLIEAPSFSL